MSPRERILPRERSVNVIAVTGGKGGTGKTSISVNLATALVQAGERVLLLDGDLGLANVDVMLGLTPRHTLENVLNGERTLGEVILHSRAGVQVIPASSGVSRMADLGSAEHAAIVHAFATLPSSVDTLIVDTAAGIGDSVRRFIEAAHHVLVVLCDEPASLTDAYALIKVMSREHGVRRFQVLINKVRDSVGAEQLFRRLQQVTDRYLDVTLSYAGEVPDDRLLLKSVRAQRPVVEAYPSCLAARAIQRLARSCRQWPMPESGSGRLEFFFEKLFANETPRLRVVK
jgi:flagellar biosynthesis protein FlhG